MQCTYKCILTLACILSLLVGSSHEASGAESHKFKVATFEADVTIPVGHACMGGGISDAKEIVDPLLAKGFVLTGGPDPVVVIAVDYCQLNNDAYDRWREVLATAAGTTRSQVMLATVHQHDAPICDLRAQALLDEQGLAHLLCDAAFLEQAIQKTAAALKQSMQTPHIVTHVGVGQATVKNIASNRRVVMSNGSVNWDRGSASKQQYGDAPEGLIDPQLKTISLWDGDRPVLAWSAYAVHPMSHYGKGRVSADFVGMARARRQADEPGVFQMYFTGCAGDTTAGKYNSGEPEERTVLAERLYQGMIQAWKVTRRVPLNRLEFRAVPLRLPVREGGDFAPEAERKILADKTAGRWRRNCAAMGLSWRERVNQPIDVPCLELNGSVAFMVMPAEAFVEYQLIAQRLRPDAFVMVSGYGDGAPGYMPTDGCWKEGWKDDYCWIEPMADARMIDAMATALGAARSGPTSASSSAASATFGHAVVKGEEPPAYEWVCVTPKAAFAPRDGAGSLTFDGRMWLIGGWHPRDDRQPFPRTCTNEVWSSRDGVEWILDKPNTFLDATFDATKDWEGRHTAGYVVHQNKMWIIGGDPIQGHYQSDVWNSADGKTWTQVNQGKPPPWGPRALAYTVAFRDWIWVIGGQTVPQFAPADEKFYRDIWRSRDGVEWEKVAPEEPYWPQRGMIGGGAVFKDRIWVIGGGTYDTPQTPKRKYFNDVWSSADGIHWKQHVERAPWAARQYHDVAVFDEKLWVLEGFSNENRNDVWYSADGDQWHEIPATPWKPRHAASVFVHDGSLWMVAGNNLESDVWRLRSKIVPAKAARS